MKWLLTILLAVLMVLSLAACGGSGGSTTGSGSGSGTAGSAANSGTTGSGSGAGKAETSSDGGKTETPPADIDLNEAMSALDALLGEDENMGTKYYKFPKAADYETWPDTSVWESMGMIDLTPRTCENGSIYNDGQYYTEGLGMWNGYSAKCVCGEGDLEDLMQRLWDAGYRGMCVGDGIIIDADDMYDLYDEDDGYGAFYEYDGWVLYVEISPSSWDGGVYCAVYDALTMDGWYEPELPKVAWPSAAQQKMPGDVGGIGSKYDGIWDDDSEDYYSDCHCLYAKDISKAQFDAYIEKVSAMDGVYCGWSDCDEGWEAYDIAYDSDYSYWISVSYCEKAQLVMWYWVED